MQSRHPSSLTVCRRQKRFHWQAVVVWLPNDICHWRSQWGVSVPPFPPPFGFDLLHSDILNLIKIVFLSKYVTSGTGHDFYELVVTSFLTNLLNNCLNVSETIGVSESQKDVRAGISIWDQRDFLNIKMSSEFQVSTNVKLENLNFSTVLYGHVCLPIKLFPNQYCTILSRSFEMQIPSIPRILFPRDCKWYPCPWNPCRRILVLKSDQFRYY